jgi:hypothetical protein
MKKRSFKLLIVILVIFLGTVACNISSFGNNKNSEDEISSNEYSSKEGGFSFEIVEDYTINEILAGVEMTAPDATLEVGPGMQLFGSLTDQEQTTEEMWDIITNPESSQFEFEKPKKYEVDDEKGLIATFEGEQAGEPVKGKIFLVMVKPDQQFMMFGIAPQDEWKEFEDIFDDVLVSVKFFEAVPIDTSYEEEEDWEYEEELSNEDTDNESVAPVTPPVNEVVVQEPQIIRQWASNAYASTEYSSTDWSATQATGAPDVNSCGSNPKAWSPAYIDSEEYIEVFYDIPVIPTELVIYQSLNPSQVVEIQLVDTNGEAWLLWYGDPEEVSDCPDMWTHTIELEETFLAQSIVIFVDQGMMNWGGVEIDAVELVGYPEGAEISTSTIVVEPEENTDQASAGTNSGDIPTNYEGLMAGPVYQGWINVIVNETKEADLDRIMTIPGKESTEAWKPRPEHKMTYLYQMPWEGMTGYISVTTDGIVYKKSVTSFTHPTDFVLDTVTWEMYEELKAVYDRDKVIPYSVMANMLESPGFQYEQYFRTDDGKLISTYTWYNAEGDRISGYFLDGTLTGIMGLNFIEHE